MSQYPSYCGLMCDECTYRENTGCGGCTAQGGMMFWGTCPLATCAMERKLGHCGQCGEFPCADYTRFAEDPEHGGNRMEVVRRWVSEGR